MEARIPLAGSFISRNNNASTFYTDDQVFENCYIEMANNPATGQRTIYCNKRPGLKTGNSAASNYANFGMPCWWSGRSTGPIAVFPFHSGSAARVYDSDGNLIGSSISIPGGSAGGMSYINETLISGTAYLTWVLQNGSGIYHAYFIAEGGGSWTEITSGNYPINQSPALATAGEMVHMDGFAFIMDTAGNIWNSDLNSLANWSATSFINASAMPDGGVGLARSKTLIVAFGRSSVEFFQNAGNPSGSPLSRIPSASRKIGVFCGVTSGFANLRSIMTAGDSIYFLGIDQQSGGIGVYVINDSQISKISTPSIDRVLNSLSQVANTSIYLGGGFVAHGLTHIFLNVSASGIIRAYCFCVETSFWWEFTQSRGGVPLACIGGNGESYFAAYSPQNNISTFGGNSPVYQDNGNPYSAVIRTSPVDFGTSKFKFWDSLRLVGDRQATSGTTEIIWSDDDYGTFSTQRNYLSLDGSTGYASTADSAALDITGDIEIVVCAAATNWTVGSQQNLVSKFAGGGQFSYAFYLDASNKLGAQFTSNGSSIFQAGSSTGVVASLGFPLWLRMIRAQASGAVNFYTSNQAPSTPVSAVTWVALGTQQTAAAGLIFSGTSDLEVGAQLGGGSQNFAGKIYSAYVYNGIGGTLVASFQAADAMPRALSLVSSLTGESWSWPVGTAAVLTSDSSVDLSTANNKLTRLGTSRRRAFEIIDSVNRPFRAEALEFSYRVGNS